MNKIKCTICKYIHEFKDRIPCFSMIYDKNKLSCPKCSAKTYIDYMPKLKKK